MARSEIRQNIVSKRWVIFAPARGKRPLDFKKPHGEERTLPERDDHCPFCPGNEHMLTSVYMEIPKAGGCGWQTRVVPNKFPALTPEGNLTRNVNGLYVFMDGLGRHEVIIENDLHNRQIALMSLEEVLTVIETYHLSYLEAMKEHENMLALIFRNHGPRAGTSLIHPHSQLIVTSIVPQYIRWQEELAERYFDDWGRCVYCDIVDSELEAGRRVIMDTPSFVAFIPYAAEVPFETWIVPKTHRADFGSISNEEKRDLAAVLHAVIGRLYRKLNDPDYNYIINTSARYRSDEPQLHWYLLIRPRLTTQAGFEIGSGISINPSFPERDAEFLRE